LIDVLLQGPSQLPCRIRRLNERLYPISSRSASYSLPTLVCALITDAKATSRGPPLRVRMISPPAADPKERARIKPKCYHARTDPHLFCQTTPPARLRPYWVWTSSPASVFQIVSTRRPKRSSNIQIQGLPPFKQPPRANRFKFLNPSLPPRPRPLLFLG
jgi:hypothetical protein